MNVHETNMARLKPPADDLKRRRPVWEAMSEFFLDTQLESADHTRIAEILMASGYSLDELDYILWREVSPVLWSNLASMAGIWDGFDMKDVEEQILRRPAGKLRSWWCQISGGRLANEPWEAVRSILAQRHY
jgi:hypothetical protein